MTRSGAPFHGAIGEGRTVSSAASAQSPDAASVGEPTVEKRNKAVAAAANRLARSIFDNLPGGARNRARPCRRDRINRIAELAGDQSANLTAIL